MISYSGQYMLSSFNVIKSRYPDKVCINYNPLTWTVGDVAFSVKDISILDFGIFICTLPILFFKLNIETPGTKYGHANLLVVNNLTKQAYRYDPEDGNDIKFIDLHLEMIFRTQGYHYGKNTLYTGIQTVAKSPDLCNTAVLYSVLKTVDSKKYTFIEPLKHIEKGDMYFAKNELYNLVYDMLCEMFMKLPNRELKETFLKYNILEENDRILFLVLISKYM
jgi:hypothetical protein